MAHAPLDADSVRLRPLADADSLEDLTDLLHLAYAALAASGMRYTASYQDAGVTRRRIARGECWVAEAGGRVVGTIVLVAPGEGNGPALYSQPGVAKVEQLGVHPDWQGRGLGARLMGHVEARARDLGATTIALDTSEHAHRLMAWYEARGYERAGTYDWRPHTNYVSVILRRALAAG